MPLELIAQITDSHVGIGPLSNGGSADALARAVDAIRRVEPRPVAVLFTGDIAANGSREEYELVRELLAPLAMPVHPLMGNHDDRAALRAAFADHAGVAAADGFVQYTTRCGSARLIALDTMNPGTDGGKLCDERLAWLETELAARSDGPTILALHHPPILTGISEFDEEIGLAPAERTALAELIGAAGGVDLIVSGHIHRAIRGHLGQTPVHICPSVHLQARLNFRPGAPIELVPETPGFAIHLLGRDGTIVSHLQTIEPAA